MPVEKKLDRPTDTDPSSITYTAGMQKVICCHECGESIFTMRRVKDVDGNMTRPAKYICQPCWLRERVLKKELAKAIEGVV